MDALAMGAILAIQFRRPSSDQPRAFHARLAFFMCAAAAAGIYFVAFWRHPAATASDPLMRSIGYSAIDFTCATLLCWILLSPEGRTARALRQRALVYTGQIAYGLYLLHEPASWIARKLISQITAIRVETHDPLSVPITFAASFLAAGLSWKFLESPIQALKERFYAPRQ
jgi:peptidoglycan/LPS O-acetylase OafA/YrhL